jgi:hypothetical protein
LVSAALALAGSLTFTGSAKAQEAARPADAQATPAVSDHEMMVGTFAVGYLGRYRVPLGNFLADHTPDTEDNPGSATAPVLGVRYWLSSLLGIDAGIGFSVTSAKTKLVDPGTSESRDEAGITTMLFHAGVPLALAGARHFSFQVVPEANFGWAAQKVTEPGNARKHSGTVIDVGARAGAELHFGFIKVPQLSLQGSIGALLSLESQKSNWTDAGAKTTRSEFAFGTSYQNRDDRTVKDPWDIFTSNISALYYF